MTAAAAQPSKGSHVFTVVKRQAISNLATTSSGIEVAAILTAGLTIGDGTSLAYFEVAGAARATIAGATILKFGIFNVGLYTHAHPGESGGTLTLQKRA